MHCKIRLVLLKFNLLTCMASQLIVVANEATIYIITVMIPHSMPLGYTFVQFLVLTKLVNTPWI